LVAVIAALGLVPSAGADGADDAWKILEKAEKFELYSLDPDLGDQQKDGYHGWKVLGHTTITDKELRKKLVVTLGDAIDNFVGGGKKKCFDPRHAIRVTVEKKTYDFLICFQCDYVYVYSGDKRVAVWNTGPTPEKLFDQTLSDVKVPLPKSPDE
jgi:hypothetical protein